MKALQQTSTICLLSFLSACQPNVTPLNIVAPTLTTPPIVAPAATTSKQELKIEDIQAQVNLKNYGSALESVNEYINRQPTSADAFYLRARIQSAVGDYSAATISLEQALQAGLKNPSEVLTDTTLVEYRKSDSFKQLKTKYSVLAQGKDNSTKKRSNENVMIIKAGDITLRLPNN